MQAPNAFVIMLNCRLYVSSNCHVPNVNINLFWLKQSSRPIQHHLVCRLRYTSWEGDYVMYSKVAEIPNIFFFEFEPKCDRFCTDLSTDCPQ